MAVTFRELAERGVAQSSSVLDDKDRDVLTKKPIGIPKPVEQIDLKKPKTETEKRLDSLFSGTKEKNEEEVFTKTYNATLNNSAVRDAAIRFAKDRLGIDDVTEEEAMDEFLEHFREFNVNELTAAGDYNYVSAAAADATKKKDEKATQRLSDYRLLMQSFTELPAFSGGVGQTFADYAEGLLKAPSTYIGLVLPGGGKATGVAATQAAKAGVVRTLTTALASPVSSVAQYAAARPIRTTIAVEGLASAAQNIAAQKTEMEVDLRDDYKLSETALAFGLGAAAPAALVARGAKSAARAKIEAKTGDIVSEGSEAIAKANEEALIKAEKIIKTNKVLASSISDALKPLDPEKVSQGRVIRTGMEASEGISSELILSVDNNHTKRIFAAVVEIMAESKMGLKEGERITEGVARVVKELDLGEKVLPDIMKKYNITSDDLANLLIVDASDQARAFAARGAAKNKVFRSLSSVASDSLFSIDDSVKKSIDDLGKAIESGDTRAALEVGEKIEGVGVERLTFQTLDAVRLASMTSQVGTTVRNVASGYARVGIDVLTTAVDRGTASFLKNVGVGKSKKGFDILRGTPNEDILAVVYGLANKKQTDAIDAAFKAGFYKKSTQLFRELQDIGDGLGKSGTKGKVAALRDYSRKINALNTFSDNMFKRVAFVGNLKRQLNEKYARIASNTEAQKEYFKQTGKKFLDEKDFNLENIIREGNFNAMFSGKEGTKALDKAISDSLYFTYQRSPESPFVKGLIDGIHKAPFLTTSLVPFPRFVANAMRFTYEYSPLYMLGKNKDGSRVISQLVGKGNEDNYEKISKALVGTALYSAAYAFRNSEYAGENWYEAKLPDGKTFDMRPFFPAAPFLFIADLASRYDKEDPIVGDRGWLTDSIQALSGTQFRAGFGIWALDSAITDVFSGDATQGEKLAKMTGNWASNIASTFTIPLTFGQDMYNTFLSPDDERIVRNTDSSNLTQLIINKSLARVPANFAIEKWLEETVGDKTIYQAPSEYESPLREETLRRITPITRQTYGILIQENKNFLEKEMARLKMSRRKLVSKTGVPEADDLIGKLFGEYVKDYIVPVLKNSERYKNLASDEQALYIDSLIDDYKQQVMSAVKVNSKFGGMERYGFDPMERVAFKKFNSVVRRKTLAYYHKIYGEPKDGSKYDFEELVRIGKVIQKMGVR